jgi:hypothetical protein
MPASSPGLSPLSAAVLPKRCDLGNRSGVLAGLLDPDAALAAGAVELIGGESLFADFVATFTAPYSAALSP